MSVMAVHADGIFRGNRIDPIPAWKLGRVELLVVPIAVENPLALGQLCGLVPDPGHEIDSTLGLP